jgi:hypothetical protein
MKFMSFMFALFCATAALAKTDAGLFNQAIREGIKQEVKKDGVIYKSPTAGRSPASVPATDDPKSYPANKIEKQHKQLGHSDW